MNEITAFIESGIIEAYVLGLATEEEIKEVERISLLSDKVRVAIDNFSIRVEQQALSNAIAPDTVIKPFLMATCDYTKRLENGERVSFAPLLHEGSKISDFDEWLKRPDMALPKDGDEIFAKIISHTPNMLTAIVWLKDIAPEETHDTELEKFLIVEGSCNIIVEDETIALLPGDYFEIPLFKNHMVKVTSQCFCKIILQRVVA